MEEIYINGVCTQIGHSCYSAVGVEVTVADEIYSKNNIRVK